MYDSPSCSITAVNALRMATLHTVSASQGQSLVNHGHAPRRPPRLSVQLNPATRGRQETRHTLGAPESPERLPRGLP